MNRSESIAKLADALAKAQGQLKAAKKEKTNPAFKGSHYADLAAIFDACREALSKNAIAVSQVPSVKDDGRLILVTVLAHSSGEWLSGECPIQPVKNDPQGMGSAWTYAKRYSLSSMVGVAADEDDDGNAASVSNGKAATNGNGHAYVTAQQAMDLEVFADEIGANKAAFLSYLKAPTFAAIPASQYETAIAALKKKQEAVK